MPGAAVRAKFSALGGRAALRANGRFGRLLNLGAAFRAEFGAVGIRAAPGAGNGGRLEHCRAALRAEFGTWGSERAIIGTFGELGGRPGGSIQTLRNLFCDPIQT